jgi:hypothetical protein
MHTFPHHRWRYFVAAVYAVCLAAVAGRSQEEEDSFRPVAAWVNESPIYEDEVSFHVRHNARYLANAAERPHASLAHARPWVIERLMQRELMLQRMLETWGDNPRLITVLEEKSQDAVEQALQKMKKLDGDTDVDLDRMLRGWGTTLEHFRSFTQRTLAANEFERCLVLQRLKMERKNARWLPGPCQDNIGDDSDPADACWKTQLDADPRLEAYHTECDRLRRELRDRARIQIVADPNGAAK